MGSCGLAAGICGEAQVKDQVGHQLIWNIIKIT